MALKFAVSILLLLSIQNLNAQSFTLIWKSEQAVAMRFEASSFEGIKIQGKSQYLLGNIEQSGATITFTPLIPFSGNYIYEVWGSEVKLFEFSPDTELSIPRISAFFPHSDTVPANFLKFYLSFNIPMGEVNPYEKIKLYKGDERIENAILLLSPSLWNEDYTILTVWLEPGRIKTGLGPNEKRGVILQPKDIITIAVEPFRAQNGLLVQEILQRNLVVSARDEDKPDVREWNIKYPKAGSYEKLIINTSEAMDHRSTLEGLSILSSEAVIHGSFQFENDSSISFLPQDAWKKRQYKLKIDSKAEDLAGNNFIRLFEEDLSQENSAVTIDFQYIDFKVD